jgi:hypothetical protein
MLFNIFVADIPEPQYASLALYADYTTIISQHYCADQARELLQQSVDMVTTWFNK